ncbi:MAG: hypothetical protein K6G79_09660 [Bacteroidales bacterium]|nr:hypothetical protein [Bacteroidales bacterium]
MIRQKITSAVSPICQIFASDAKTHTAPYATYSLSEETLYDKNGPTAIRADVEILVVATNYDTAASIADQVIGAIGALRSEMLVKLQNREPYESTDAALFAVGLTYEITEEIQ